MSKLKRNTLHMLGSQILVALFQGLQFILIARALGAHDFGRISGILAITAVLLPFSGIGAGNVMVLRLARGSEQARVYFGNALMVATISGLILVAAAVFIGNTFLGSISTPELILIFSISEVLITKYIDIAAHVFFGYERHGYSGFFYSMHGFVRMIFAAIFFLIMYKNGELVAWAVPFIGTAGINAHGILLWAWLHLTAGLATFTLVSYITIREIGWPRLALRLALKELKVGVYYSIGLSSRSVYTDIDKAVLARFASPEINGAYTAAFRLIYMSYTPIKSVLIAAQARFFRDGALGLRLTFNMATKIITAGLIYCLVLAILLFLGAPLITYVLGSDYSLSVEILQWLSLLPLILMVQDAYSDALTGANRQVVRSVFQVVVAFICFGLNMLLVPKFSWLGAVASTYISQLLLAFLVGGLIVYLLQSENRN